MDKYVGAFETCDEKIQQTNCEDVTWQCIYCSSKVQTRPLSWSSHLVGLVLFAAIVGSNECLNKICIGEGPLHLWLCISNK
jgi:hypothetical protein